MLRVRQRKSQRQLLRLASLAMSLLAVRAEGSGLVGERALFAPLSWSETAGLVLSLCTAVALSWLLWSRVLGLLFLPSQAVYAIQQAALEQQRTEFLAQNRTARTVKIPVRAGGALPRWVGRWLAERGPGADGELDAVELPHPDGTGAGTGAAQHYLLVLPANGVVYEQTLGNTLGVQSLLSRRGWKVSCLLLNYRGVGRSSGRVLGGADLAADAGAALEWLARERGVPLERVLVHGHSIGGAAGVLAVGALAALEPSRRPFVLADRTFSSLGAVARSKLAEGVFDMAPIGALIFLNLALLCAAVLNLGLGRATPRPVALPYLVTIAALLPVRRLLEATAGPVEWPGADRRALAAAGWLRALLVALALGRAAAMLGPSAELGLLLAGLGFAVGQLGRLTALAIRLVALFGWEMDSKPLWAALHADRKLAVFHPDDEMISPNVSLLGASDAEQQQGLKISAQQQSCHMYHLFSVPQEREALLNKLAPFFQQHSR
jgi:hypothetical protein